MQRPLFAGPYRIVGELGRGAMGAVLRAVDPTLGREVAIKVALDGGGGERRRQRLVREGQVTAALEHPGIVRVHAAGLLDDGRPYLAYELVEGARTLEEVLPELDLRARVSRVRDAARALGYAHARGVVHRDVKPDNLLVGADGALKVADFGLAVARDLERLTQTGALVGTPSFMPPEMVEPAGRAVGAPADVWGLGVVLHLALADELPFEEASWWELARAICLEPPAPLPGAAPRDLAGVCGRALAKEPGARYPSGDALADDLDAWLAGGRPQAALAAQRAIRRRRWGAAGVAAIALAGGVVLLAQGAGMAAAPSARPAPPAQTIAPTPTAARPEDPAAAWAAAEAEDDPVVRAIACRRWLRRHAGHSLAERARDRLSAATQRPLARLTLVPASAAPRGAKLFVAFDAGGALWTGAPDGAVASWQLRPLREQARSLLLPHAGGAPRRLCVLGPGRLAVWASRRLWVVPSLALGPDTLRLKPWTIPGASQLEAVAAGPDGDLLALGLRQPRVLLVRLTPQPELVRILETAGPVRALLFMSGGAQLVVASASPSRPDRVERRGGSLEVWDPATGQRLRQRSLNGQPTAAVALADGETLAFGDDVGQLRLLDRGGEAVGELRVPAHVERELGFLRRGAHQGVVRALAGSPDGQLLYSVGVGGAHGVAPDVAVWDVAERRRLRTFTLPPLPRDLAVSPDGELLAVGHDDGTATVWLAGRLE